MGNQQSNKKGLHDNLVRDDKKDIEESYDIRQSSLLGQGAAGATQIKRAQRKNYEKTQHGSGVAIKLYDGKAEFPPDLEKEAKILGKCDHPNIIKLFEVNKQGKKMSLVLELCEGGPILDRAPFTEKQVSRIIRQLSSAVAYLHNKNIVHRDVDCANILFETPDENSDIKLVDFGSATELELVPDHPGAFKFLKEKTGSVHIMAPEVVRGRYGSKCDVWSIGVCTYMLLNNGEHPFKGDTADELERKIIQGSIDYRGWKHSRDAKEFCQQTMMVNSGIRLHAVSLLKHPFVAKEESKTKLPNELVMSFDLFRIAPPLKRLALNALAKTSKQSSHYRTLFRDLDEQQAGVLSKDAFMKGFKNSGDSEEELEDLFKKLDVNCNGEIMYTEFLAATLEAEGELGESQLHEAFDLLSRNSRVITKKSLMKLFGQKSDKKVRLETLAKSSIGKQVQEPTEVDKALQSFVESIFVDKDEYDFEEFAQLFEHGFDATRSMDAIVETSLNEEQLSKLKDDDLEKHLQTIREYED